MPRYRLTFLLTLILSLGSLHGFAQQALTNDSVIKMVKAGLSDDLIVQSINASPGTYATSTDDLIALKQAGVSDKIVGAMVVKGTAPATPPPTLTQGVNPSIAGIDEVGVYYKDREGKWVDVAAENVNFKTGGVMKSIATDGIVKGDLNGHLTGPTSKLQLNSPIEFTIYVLEGQAPGEYQLLHLHTHSDGREFRSETGGVFHKSGGAQRDTVAFESKKVAPRIYLITVTDHLAKGEYGFLPPATMNSGKNLASSGKMYTFGFVE